MKNQPVFFAFLTLLFLLVSYGCPIDPSGGLDPCEEIICYNGGVCVDGECDCPPGYYGPKCENKIEEDPCEGITCYNGGVCVDGECDCPPGFTGPNCETEVASYMRITGISLKDWPSSNPLGESWDPMSYPIPSPNPEIYFEFKMNGTSVGTTAWQTPFLPDGGPYEYSGFSYTFPGSAEVTLIIWDYDGADESEFMAAENFIPFDWSDGLKEKLVMGTQGFAFDLYVEWVF